jgi:molybdenum cofactor biosynthesis enzyme MoaA
MGYIFANDRLRISITNNCIFNCKYCTNEGQIHNHNDFIDIDFIKRLSDFIKTNDIYIKKINITGGEPLLHPQLLEIAGILKKCTDSLTLNTNGQLLDFNGIIDLKNSGIDCIKFGIDSFFQETTKPFYKKTNCNPGKIIENLFFAKKIMPRSSVNIVLTDFNYPEFEEILYFCISNKINLVEFLELIKFDFRSLGKSLRYGILFSDIFKRNGSLFKKISYNIKLGKYLCETYNGLTMQFADDFCKSRVCRNLWTRIDSCGNLIPCIKSRDKIKIDFNRLLEQIATNNLLMCEGPLSKKIVRDYKGQLLPGNKRGDYFPSYTDIFRDSRIELADLDL